LSVVTKFANRDEVSVFLGNLETDSIIGVPLLASNCEKGRLNYQAGDTFLHEITTNIMCDLRLSMFKPLDRSVEIQ
jgi:hypothetical protein